MSIVIPELGRSGLRLVDGCDPTDLTVVAGYRFNSLNQMGITKYLQAIVGDRYQSTSRTIPGSEVQDTVAR